ncbi:MAG: hypothetical protein RI885_2190 [Actinomycetota bacterium]|jgi:NADPH-dependent 2,4-dienoyl-CoA reductase/sulfur reductase-like enzyme
MSGRLLGAPGYGARDRVLIVGASLGGLRSAQALRADGFDGDITVLGAESHPPYDRPPLSKQVLTGDRPATRPLAGIDAVRATWILGDPAATLDLAAGAVTTKSGVVHSADAIVIATGASPRWWTGPGARTPGVIGLHTAEDARVLRAALDRGADIVVVGGGFVGAEVAAAARARGCRAVLAVRAGLVLLSALGLEVARFVTDRLDDAGVDLRTSTTLTALTAGADGSLARADFDDGSTVRAGLAVIGIGVEPSTAWLRGSGLILEDGIVCDENCLALVRPGVATSVPVVAVGDVARLPDPLGSGALVAVRHWSNATEQAKAAAATLLAPRGTAPSYRQVPTFWSDLTAPGLRLRLRGVGMTRGADAISVVDGSLEAGAALVGYWRDGTMVGAVSLDRPRRLPEMRDLILAGAAIDVEVDRMAV